MPVPLAPPQSARAALRVLWLSTSADTDGPGRALLAVLNRWCRDDAVAVCSLRGVSPSFRGECRHDIESHSFGMRGGWDLTAVARLTAFCRRWRPDVIHTQLSRADWIGRPLGWFLGVPVVSTIHNIHSRMYRAEFSPVVAQLGIWCDRLSARGASRFVAVSDGVRRDLEAQGIPAGRISVIHNGFNQDGRAPALARDDVRRSWNIAPDDVAVGTVALFKAQKGLSFLVEAARIAAAENPKLQFVHMGDGPLRDDIVRQIAAAGLAGRFRLIGRVPDPTTLLAGLDVFVLSSMWEGLPIALLEAMSAGLPAIGTAVSGIEEVIEENRTGVLVPPADASALARAMLRLAADSRERRRLGDGALRRLSRFAPDLVASEYRQLTLDVLVPGALSAVPIERPTVRKASNM